MTKGPRPRSAIERLLTHIEIVTESGCWIWMGATDGNGYGRIQIGSFKAPRFRRVHIIAYTSLVGPVPKELQLDHLCRVRCCVNPHHLEPVTRRENIQRGNAGKYQREKKHCPKGHEYTESNTIFRKRTDGRPYQNRLCRTCLRANSRARYHRLTASSSA